MRGGPTPPAAVGYRVGVIGSLGRARRIELLERMPLFSTCSKRQLAQVAALTVAADLPKGTVMTRQGAVGGLAYVIASGQAEVSRDGKAIARLGPGDVVGELSLIDGKPRSATVTATTDLEVLELDSEDLLTLMRKAPPVVRKLLEALAQRVRAVDSQSMA
jgi:CRP/FNR family transcriptional regulator, cyclic AMP receptor protein